MAARVLDFQGAMKAMRHQPVGDEPELPVDTR
jgi:hypothetical protein